MKNEKDKKALGLALTEYVRTLHNQDECVGFIAGFEDSVKYFRTKIHSIKSKVLNDLESVGRLEEANRIKKIFDND